MKIAILGANGYLGRYLSQALFIAGYEIIPVFRSTVDLSNRVLVGQWLAQIKPNVVINCAGVGATVDVANLTRQRSVEMLDVFLNFQIHNQYFDKFINIGSGAEFDRTKNINCALESDILRAYPLDHYGQVKNKIATMILQCDKFYTLRLFGCFDSSEHTSRLFKQLQTRQHVSITDRIFDYISASDFAIVVNYYITNNNLPKDLNCVYEFKQSLYSVATEFIKTHSLATELEIFDTSTLNYTGSGLELSKLYLPLDGLSQGIKNYE